ncbi:hypothetical protein ACF08W_22870 [Streptomyces sp. NPDC015144]|uniref:hypothetical protein n=1 Tax=Streptomyces sp. NPDC015144 TaxID=3364944 RepID=UPI0036F55460
MAGSGDLRRGAGALEKFRRRVDTLLAELEGSAAGRSRIAAQKVSRSALSGRNACFAEADGLHTQYDRVHEELVALSRTLGDQIEYLSLGVHEKTSSSPASAPAPAQPGEKGRADGPVAAGAGEETSGGGSLGLVLGGAAVAVVGGGAFALARRRRTS